MTKQGSTSKWRMILLATLMMALLTMAACAGAPPADSGADDQAAEAEATAPADSEADASADSEDATTYKGEYYRIPVDGGGETVTIFRGGVTLDWDTDPIIQEIEARTNTDIQFATVDWGDINQFRNLAMSTEEDIDIYHHMDTNYQWIEDGFVIPLDDYIDPERHPFLTALVNSDAYADMKRDGQVYYIPMLSGGSDWVLIARQDWMDELGLDMPTNEVEFRELLQAFKDRDSDGRSTGMQIEGSRQIRRSMTPIFSAFGAPVSFFDVERNYWVGDDGQLIPVATSDNVKAALQFVNGLYADGLVNTDFASLTSFPQTSEIYLQGGKAGVGWIPSGGGFNVPDSELVPLAPFTAEGFEFSRAEGIDSNGFIAVSATSENPQLAVDMLEFFNSREGRELLVLGIDGVHYENLQDDGSFDRISENWEYDPIYYPLHFYLGQGVVRGYIPLTEGYDSIGDALKEVTIWEPNEGGVGLPKLMEASQEWIGAPMIFQF
ncbi:MAG: extracellular solute-binding protein, partial [Caldilineaceae bacterium]|nr:extracellular solute-binding protein [Caldilineaceae bacterium]